MEVRRRRMTVLTRAEVVQMTAEAAARKASTHGKHRKGRSERAGRAGEGSQCATAAGDPGTALPASAKPLACEKSEREERNACTETFAGKRYRCLLPPIGCRALFCMRPSCLVVSISYYLVLSLCLPARPSLALDVVNIELCTLRSTATRSYQQRLMTYVNTAQAQIWPE